MAREINIDEIFPKILINREDYIKGIKRGSKLILDNFCFDMRLFKEIAIIEVGPSHKWWLSARLLLGLTEAEAMEIHRFKNMPSLLTVGEVMAKYD